ncbi:oligosaccharide flippase family protein [Enterococcus faecium]|uniref:Oligosaccharide flippase family protein n=1 Tax=Enterococcus faecium TaxID=1352 RepID=A0AAW8RMQ9_ENTFC|nr:oligosaccharide flippase family protein [Enterococcus faecium]MDT2370754.1 oligosaccharide flippase family protein [Enterococcus faecium]
MRKFFKLYKKMSDPIKASLWFTISSVIQRSISLLTTPIFTRLLTTEQYGVYSVYQSWYSIIIIFATLNLYAGVYNNGMTKWPNDRPKFTSSLLGLSSTVTVVLFGIYLAAMDFWNNIFGLSTLFVIAIFIEAFFVPAFHFWAAGERYDYKYQKLVLVTILMALMSPLLGIIAILSTKYKVEARVLSFVGIQVCIGLIFYIYIMRQGGKFYIKNYWKFALAFNLPLIPHYLSQTVLNQADRIMISNMVGKSEAAIYSVAYTISMMFTIVTSAINNSFIPYTYKAIKEQKYKDLRRNSTFLVLIVGIFCMVATAFGPEIIKVFAALEYYDARWIIPPVAESLLFMFIYPLFSNVEFYFEETKFIMIASGLAACVNIGLNYIGIQLFGYIAAAYTTLICYILLTLAHYIVYRIVCIKNGIQTRIYNIKFLMIYSIISICLMIVMIIIYDIWYIRYAVILIICSIMIWKRKLLLSKFKEIWKS